MTYLYPFPPGTRKSQPFGANKSAGANGPGGHTGDDYAVPVGTPVRAAADGVIELSSWVSENYQANPWWLTQMGGDSLVLNAGSTKPTFVYAHLSESLADVGDRVYKGQIIGYTGNTGTATTGPHCHVEVLPPGYVLNSATYGRVDPELFFDEHYTALSYQSLPDAGETFMYLDDAKQKDLYWQLCTDEGRDAQAVRTAKAILDAPVDSLDSTGKPVTTTLRTKIRHMAPNHTELHNLVADIHDAVKDKN